MGTHYSPKIVTDGLVLCLDAANPKSYPGTGTVWNNMISDNYHCTLDATETSFLTDNNGVIYFNTGISTITGPDTPNSFTSFTAFKKIGLQTNTFHVLFGGQTHEISIESNSDLRVGTYTSSRTTMDVSAATMGIDLLDGEWHIITARYDGGNLTSYVNGELQSTLAKTGTTNSTYKLSKIGCWEDNGYQANGYIPFCMMYDVALTDDEIKQNFNALRGRFNI